MSERAPGRAGILDASFGRFVTEGRLPAPRYGSDFRLEHSGLSAAEAVSIFESQVMSRHLDLEARILRARDQGFYTIGSSGHEGNAAVAAALRFTDMAFLHYRSGAFLIHRSKQRPGETPLYDMLLSFAGSAEDPVSGGRHKVLGSKTLFVPPQTSTIASHLPKAMGAAFSIPRARDLGFESEMPHEAVAVCSFGDASANHSTALGAFNTAEWMAVQQVPLPLIFVCEDNGIGVSVKTPQNWIHNLYSARPGLKYFACDGLNFAETFAVTREAAEYARTLRKPVFLHVQTVRLLGHAGSDIEEAYRSAAEIEAGELNDPLLHSARLLIEAGVLSVHDILNIYESIRSRVARVGEVAIKRRKPRDSAEIMSSIVPPFGNVVKRPAKQIREFPEAPKGKQHLARLMTGVLGETLQNYPSSVIFGEDVGAKGGVYGVTVGLQKQFSRRRVFDSLLDEQSILGTAIGMAHNGFVPIPEIQFLAYVHNAEDQIRGEAATLSYFSQGRYTNGMVIRIAGLAYQKGFGGHFHNDNSLNIFRDIPGVVVAVPSNGRSAVRLFRECMRLAEEEGRVVVFVEPIALYMTRDLHEKGDGLWTFGYPALSEHSHFGDFEVWAGESRSPKDSVCIVTYGNGTYLSLQAALEVEKQTGSRPTVIDLQWLQPLREDLIIEALKPFSKVLIVDECRKTGSLSEQLMTLVVEKLKPFPKVARVTADDSFIALGVASTMTLPSKESIITAVKAL